jgi:ABC-2 type transport system permease protein
MTIIREISPILWDEWIVFKRNWLKITSSAVIAPILYIVAFGFGVSGGFSLKGVTYIKFLIPGIIALTTMNASYRAIAVVLNTNRLYDKTFEQFLIAPISMVNFCVAKAIAGSLRGTYCGFIVLAISYAFGVRININAAFVLIMLLSGLTFACLGMLGALVVNSHADMTRFATFVMLPMTFLCGTFFSVEKLPYVFKSIIYVFPLTHVSYMLRAIASYQPFYLVNLLVVFAYLVLFFSLCVYRCKKVSA